MSDDTEYEDLIDFSPGFSAEDESLFVPEEIKEEEEPAKPKLKLDYASGTYSETAVIVDQFEKFPDTVKFGPPQAAVLNLQKETDLTAYNNLLQKTHPDSAPQIVITDHRVNDDYVVMVTYKKLTYLIPG